MTVYSTDSFNRANSSSTMGSTDGAGTLDPLTWTPGIGTWGISSNQAYLATGGGSPTAGVTVVNLGTGDVDISVTISNVGNVAEGLCFRYSNTSNYFTLTIDTSKYTLAKLVAGAGQQLQQPGITANNGDIIRVQALGPSIAWFINGHLQGNLGDTFNQTATNHGLVQSSGPGAGGELWDNWSASSISSNTAPILGQTAPYVLTQSSVAAPIVSSTFPPVLTQYWPVTTMVVPPPPPLPILNVIRGPAINITPPTPLIHGQALSKNVLIQYQSDGPINAPT